MFSVVILGSLVTYVRVRFDSAMPDLVGLDTFRQGDGYDQVPKLCI